MATSFQRLIGGISDYTKEALEPDSAAFVRFIDYRRDPRRWTLLPKATNEAAVTGLPKWAERISDTTYVYDDNGKIYTRSLAGSVAVVNNTPGSSGNGLKYFGEDDYLYYTTDTVIGRYGPMGGTPTFVDDFLGAQGGIPTNTYSLDLESGSSQYATAADSASLSITGDITLETWRKPETLPTAGNEMVLISKWNEASDQRSYKWNVKALTGITYPQLVDLKGHWKMNDASGSRTDSSGNGNTLTDNATVASNIDCKEGFLSSDFELSSSEYLSITDAAQTGLDITGDLSIAMWVKFETTATQQGLATKWSGSSQKAFIFQFTSNTLSFVVTTDGSTQVGKDVAWTPSAGTWYHIGMVYDASAGEVAFYVNGAQQGTTQTGAPTSIFNGSGPFILGAFQDSAVTGFFDGLMDDVLVWARELTSAEISDLYNEYSGADLTYYSVLYISSTGANTETYFKALSQIAVGSWVHLGVSWDASASLATFYEQGTNIGTYSGALTAIFNSTALLGIGASFDAAGAAEDFFDGLTDENRVHNDLRSDNEISSNKDQELLGTDPNLVAYYQHDNALTDDSPQANTLTLVNTPVYTTTVPFSGATTRLDIDKSDTSTGQTYTLPTATSEADTARQTFIPAKDPQKSISVFVAGKGSGNWTLTVHDPQNRVIATKTIATGDVPASGEVEFTFATPWRPILGATYHFHVTTTVADGTIVSGTLNDLETGQFYSYYQFLVTDADHHPIEKIINLLTIGNERYVATWDGTTYNPHRLTFPSGWKVRAIGQWREYIAYGCWKGSSIGSYDEGIIFFWDGTADTYNFYINVPEGAINAMFGSQGALTFVAGYQGDILEYRGGDRAAKIKRLPKLETGKQIEILPGALTMWQTMIRIGVGVTDSSNVEQGVYTWGKINENYADSLSFDYHISTGNTQSTAIQIGLVYPVEKKLLIGWKNNTAYGLDAVNPAGTSYQDGSIEFLIRDEGRIWKEKQVQLVRADFEPLISGHTIGIQYKLDRESSWSTEKTEATADKDKVRENVKAGRNKEYQVRVNAYSTTTTSPAILGVTVVEDVLADETVV